VTGQYHELKRSQHASSPQAWQIQCLVLHTQHLLKIAWLHLALGLGLGRVGRRQHMRLHEVLKRLVPGVSTVSKNKLDVTLLLVKA
jgi:hypothetical protein